MGSSFCAALRMTHTGHFMIKDKCASQDLAPADCPCQLTARTDIRSAGSGLAVTRLHHNWHLWAADGIKRMSGQDEYGLGPPEQVSQVQDWTHLLREEPGMRSAPVRLPEVRPPKA